MALDPRRVKALFNAALDLPDPAARTAFLERECRDDRDLRALEALLAAHDQPASALERPLVEDPGETSAPDEQPAETGAGPAAVSGETASFRLASPPPDSLIGSIVARRYKLRQEIGEGGMGSVYLAEQTQPVKRHVALKLIKAGMDSRTVLARFESERQALALMDHPNIARVLDAGATEGGRPFFVMELVKGVPLTDYCDQHRLGLPERLALFRQICSAVQHAHQKGIIHRDLKPTNILVESHDGHPVPKVIDFGLAKATSGLQLSEHSLYSAFGTVAGTPLYMAPEQATFNAIDVDTRADVYALGVILYELLTGSTPIQGDTFKRAALDEMLRVIREVEPPTPSSRISSSDTLASIAATRRIEPSRLGRFIRGDLDWIVMKALAKERQRRYESPIAFSHDIERFLNHEPVSAGPPTASYRFRKFVRRHRPQVFAAALVLLVLIGGIVGTTLGLIEAKRQTVEANRQKQVAVAEAMEKEKARQAEALQRKNADEQKRQAEKRLSQIEKANEILGSIFKDLDPRNEEKEGKPLSVQLGERLDHATAQIEGEAIGDPLAVARMQMTLGDSQSGLGYPEKAIALFAKARATFAARLGPDHPDTLTSMDKLAENYHSAGKYDRALPLFEETLALRKAKLGPEHPDTIASMGNLAEAYQNNGQHARAVALYEEALALRKANLGPEHPDTLASMSGLASGYYTAGNYDRALPLYEKTLALRKSILGRDHPATLTIMNNLAEGYRMSGKSGRALPLYEESFALHKAKLGPDHPFTLASSNNLAQGYRAVGRLDRALPLYQETLTLAKLRLGPDHPHTLTSMCNLASCYQALDKLDLALPLFEESLAKRKATLGPDHPDTHTGIGYLGLGYLAAKKYDLALPLLEQILASRKATLGPDHRYTLNSMNELANGYQAAGKLDLALPLFEEALARRKAKLGPDHPSTLRTMNNLMDGYRVAGMLDRAVPLLEETLARRKAKLGPDHPNTLVAMNNLAEGYRAVGKPDLALALFEEVLAPMKSKLGPDHSNTLITMTNLALGYQAVGKFDRALPLFEETLALRKFKLGRDHPDTLTSMNYLARGYSSARKLDRALPLFEATLALRKSKLGPDHPDTLLSMNNLAIGYQADGKLDRALPLYEEALALRKSKLGPDHRDTLTSMNNLANGYRAAGKLDRALPLLRELADIWKRKAGANSTQYAGALATLGLNLLQQEKWTEAETHLREALTIRESKAPDDWSTFNTKSMLGGALLGQKQYAAAEPLLRTGYEAMKLRAAKIPAQSKLRLAEALDRLIALAEATNKPDDAQRWKDEKATLPPASAPKPETESP